MLSSANQTSDNTIHLRHRSCWNLQELETATSGWAYHYPLWVRTDRNAMRLLNVVQGKGRAKGHSVALKLSLHHDRASWSLPPAALGSCFLPSPLALKVTTNEFSFNSSILMPIELNVARLNNNEPVINRLNDNQINNARRVQIKLDTFRHVCLDLELSCNWRLLDCRLPTCRL